jgi:membrane protein YdbS with pleckstrin-like domain
MPFIVPSGVAPANVRRSERLRGEAARVRRTAHERIHLDTRRHWIVLLPSQLRALLLAAAGGFVASLSLPFPVPLLGLALVVVAAVHALRAAWRWERIHVIVTDEQLALVRRTLRRRVASVRLERVGAVEVDQGLLGRLLGYGTLRAGPLEITYVPQARSVYGLVESLSP